MNAWWWRTSIWPPLLLGALAIGTILGAAKHYEHYEYVGWWRNLAIAFVLDALVRWCRRAGRLVGHAEVARIVARSWKDGYQQGRDEEAVYQQQRTRRP